jgi:hypothetical protein
VTAPDVKGTHDAWVATIPDAELRAGDDVIVDPKPIDWVSIRGSWTAFAMVFGLTEADFDDLPNVDGDLLP